MKMEAELHGKFQLSFFLTSLIFFRPEVEEFRYPRADTPNPTSTLKLINFTLGTKNEVKNGWILQGVIYLYCFYQNRHFGQMLFLCLLASVSIFMEVKVKNIYSLIYS